MWIQYRQNLNVSGLEAQEFRYSSSPFLEIELLLILIFFLFQAEAADLNFF